MIVIFNCIVTVNEISSKWFEFFQKNLSLSDVLHKTCSKAETERE